MAFRGGRGGRKNRPSPYNMKDGKPVSWRDQGQQELQQGEILAPPPNPVAEEGAQKAAVASEGAPAQGDTSRALPPPPPPPPPGLKKFTNKARLFFGNLPRDFSEEELRNMLLAHGEIQEIYHNKEKNFAFARMVCAIFSNGDVICSIIVGLSL